MSRAAELGRPFKPWAYLPKPLTGALLPARHPLARRPVIAPAELPGETMLVAPRAVDAALHNRLVRDLEAAGGRALRAAGDPPALAAKLGLVAAGLGSAPVPRSAAR